MNNRYLYRAKLADNCEWVEGFYAVIGEKTVIIEKEREEFYDVECEKKSHGNKIVEVDPSTICQCTWLNDENGKLIFENDIVDFFDHKVAVKYECGSFGIAYRENIDWEEIEANILPITGCDNALYACKNDNYISLWEIYWNFNDEDNCLSTVEVIGNIFDNPELLEVGEFMTDQEAIETLIILKGTGTISGKEVEAIDIIDEAILELEKYRAIGTPEECRAAVERHNERKPIKNDKMALWDYTCPKCGEPLIKTDYTYKFCDMCGQKLDWSDEE